MPTPQSSPSQGSPSQGYASQMQPTPIQSTPIHELPEIILGMSLAFCGGDQRQSMALLKRVYEKQPLRAIAAETGVPETTIRRLAKGFREVCQSWLDRRERVKTGLQAQPAGGAA